MSHKSAIQLRNPSQLAIFLEPMTNPRMILFSFLAGWPDALGPVVPICENI
jgi:hypothetical protein